MPANMQCTGICVHSLFGLHFLFRGIDRKRIKDDKVQKQKRGNSENLCFHVSKLEPLKTNLLQGKILM